MSTNLNTVGELCKKLPLRFFRHNLIESLRLHPLLLAFVLFSFCPRRASNIMLKIT